MPLLREIPSPTLPATSVSPGRSEPTTLSDPAEMSMPTAPFGSAAVPAALVPMRLPAMVLPSALPVAISTPCWPLPEITLMRCETSVRPMRLSAELEIRIPSPPFPSAAVPETFVPM